jgi:hypothetical protein
MSHSTGLSSILANMVVHFHALQKLVRSTRENSCSQKSSKSSTQGMHMLSTTVRLHDARSTGDEEVEGAH